MSSTAVAPVTVFIAEDNPILLQGLEQALRANGYAVQTATNGAKMLQLLKGDDLPDLLLLDVMMPEMNGIDLLDAVRADTRTAEIPVVLITAAADQMLPKAELIDREVEVLMKPFRLADLLARIEDKVIPAGTAKGDFSSS